MPRIGELPSGAAENPSGGYGYDGSAWQRLQVDASKFLKVILQAGTAVFGKLAANDGVDIGDIGVKDIAGVVPQLDDVDKLAVSLYVQGTNPGDTALLAESAVRGALRTSLSLNGNQAAVSNKSGDGQGYDLVGLCVHSNPHLYNGTNCDRWRGNVEAILLASAARTATTNSADQTNYNGVGLILFLDVSAVTATPSITLTLQIKDSISGDYFTVWTAAAAVTTTGEYAYLFVPGGAAGSYTEAVNLRLGRTWRLRVTHADSDEITYSVSGVELI